jgi:hypothetical protein
MSDVKKIVVNLDALQMKAPRKQKQTRKSTNIVPNKLKDTFLKQVQHHKSLANAQKQKPQVDPIKYTDDFNSSVEYLNNIKKTIQPVHADLPVELMEPANNAPNLIPKLVEKEKETEQEPAKYKVDTAVPYGCLKNGIKPSFKNWTRNNRAKSPSFEKSTTFFEPNKTLQLVTPQLVTPQPLVQQVSPQPVTQQPVTPQPVTPQPVTPQQVVQPVTQQQVTPPPKVQIQTPPLTTIKRHVIGKSKKSRHVGVLIKNVNTRKMIISAHKDLKKTNINEVRNHLKNNGLLKVGTTAPIDVLRQTYEASILAGNINNKNDETLYHNFVNDTKEI